MKGKKGGGGIWCGKKWRKNEEKLNTINQLRLRKKRGRGKKFVEEVLKKRKGRKEKDR